MKKEMHNKIILLLLAIVLTFTVGVQLSANVPVLGTILSTVASIPYVLLIVHLIALIWAIVNLF